MRIRLMVIAIILAIARDSTAFGEAAQEQPRQEAARQRAARQAQKAAAEQTEKAEAEVAPAGQEELMRKSLGELSAQINQLTEEVRRLRKDNERNSDAMQLLLYEERLAKVEEKVQGAIDYRAQLDAREAELQRRSRNIQQEVSLRGGLRRDEVEAAVRADFQRALEDVHTQQSAYQQRIAELQAQATRLRSRVETLRKKVERSEQKEEQQQ